MIEKEHVLRYHYGSTRVVGKSFYTLKSEDEFKNLINFVDEGWAEVVNVFDWKVLGHAVNENESGWVEGFEDLIDVLLTWVGRTQPD